MPLLRPKPNSSPQHWSKDFVEHLRSVHFALLTVAVGLILLLSSKTYDPRAAAEQMDVVVRYDALWRLKGVFNGTTESGDDTLSLPHDGKALALSGSSFLATTSITKQTIRVNLKDSTLLYLCVSHRYDSYEIQQLAHTLNEFQEGWDTFEHGPYNVDLVTSIVRLGRVDPYGPPSAADDAVLHRSDWQSGDILTIVADNDTANPAALTKGIRSVDISLGGQPCVRSSGETRPRFVGTSGNLAFSFAVAAVKRARILAPETYFDIDSNIVRPTEYAEHDKFTEPEHTVIEFGERFPDLVEAGRGRMNEDFTTLAPEIRSESNKGDEAFDAFGIKFPSEQVTRWGIIVLIGVQLYFLMYLVRLSTTLKKDDPAWQVPFMAMDQSWLARAMLFVSVLCLPIYAAFRVAVRALQSSPHDTVLVVIRSIRLPLIRQNVWILVGFVASVSLSVLCWKYRPKLIEPVAPPEVLEDQGSGI